MGRTILLSLVFLFSACTSTHQIGPGMHLNVMDSDSNLSSSLVKSFRKRFNDNGFLEIEVVLKSVFSKNVVCKITWLDKDGFALRDVINEDYQLLRIPAGQEVVLRKLAADVRARDFRLEIKVKN